jgi:MFS family permease
MNAPLNPSHLHSHISRALWGIIALMVVSVAINYIDRVGLSTAAPLLRREMSIPPEKMGWLLAAFFWSYALLQVASGWLVDRYEVKWVMAIGFSVWSLATAATGLAQSLGGLILFRLLLGVGESVAYPCYSKIIAAHCTEHQRGRANSLIDAGTKLGPAIGALAGGMLMARFGWRPIFIVLGLGSLLWLPAWFMWMPRGQANAEAGTKVGPGFAEILSKRAFWATFLGHFCGNYFWYFLLTWLPTYLVEKRGFSMDRMAVVSAVAFCMTGVTTTVTGILADRAIAAGSTPTRVRKACATFGLAFATLVVGVAFVENSTAAMVILMLSCVSYGVFASSHWAIPQTIAGPLATGKWSGMQNCLANMSGVAAPAITGFVVQRTGDYFWAFAVSAGVVLIGAAGYAFLLGPVEPVIWQERKQA